jgi:hypothetical protein
MNYSRRQLYALGEPLGESVTRLKPGGRVYGGGGSPSTPEKTTQVVDLPDWAKGYAKDTLAKGSALTDISKNPYQQYGGERIAGFQPMQQQAFEGAAGMQPSQQVGLGSGIAGAAGLGALSTNYQGRNFRGGQFDTQAAEEYMSPYTQNVVDYQKSQALRDFQIAQPMRQAQAVQQGAFGGSRSAIIDAEAQRSLNSQLQGITATGQQAAFQNAQQQFNADQARRLEAQRMGEQSRQYGAGLGMQGLQTGLQAAGQLGQLGQTEYGQKMGINQLQSAYGQQQQQQAQRPLDMAYQDFINQQNYPYKQLGFMSDMIRGLPLGQQSTSQVYQGNPSTLQTVGALGMGAYGLSKAGVFGGDSKAEGGLAESYADGGVTSDQNVASIIGDLSDQQLQQAKEAALNRRDVEQAQMIDAEMAERASIRGGLGGAFNQLPLEQQETMMAANGGIVAFAGGGSYLDQVKENRQQQLGLIDQAVTQPSIAEQKTNILGQREMLNSLYPESVLPKYLEETKAERAKLSGQLERDSGFAMVLAAADLLEGASLPKAGAKAARTYIGEVSRLKSENKKADSLLRQSEIQLATAAQLQEEGRTNMAITKAEKGRELEAKGAELKAGVYGKSAEMANDLAKTQMAGDIQLRATQITTAAGERNAKLAAFKPSTQMEGVAIKAAEIKRQFPDMPEAQVRDKALQAYLSESGKYPSTDRAADARATFYEKISGNVDARLLMDKKYRELQKADKKTGGTTADQYREQLIAVEMDKARSDKAGAQGQPAPAQQQQATPVKVTSQEQFAKLPSGTTFVAPDGSVRIKP